MACKADPAFLKRWHEVYLEKYRAHGELNARQWFIRFVPDECKPNVMAAIQMGGRKK